MNKKYNTEEIIIGTEWHTLKQPNNEDVLTHSILDIARSIRKMVESNKKLLVSRQELENDLAFWKKRYYLEDQENGKLKASNRGLRAAITRMKKKRK